MTNSIKWTVGIGVLVALVLALWNMTADHAAPPALIIAETRVVDDPVVDQSPEARVDRVPTGRTLESEDVVVEVEVPLPKRIAWAPPQGFEFSLHGRVHDVWGEAQPSAQIFVAIDGGRFNRCVALDERGSFELRFRANQSKVLAHVFVRLDGSNMRGMETFELVAGKSTAVALDLLNLAAKCGSAGASVASTQGALGGPEQRTEPGGLTRFVALNGVGSTQAQDPAEKLRGYEYGWFDDEDPLEGVCSFHGKVTAADGAPAVGVLVRVRSRRDKSKASAITDRFGEWQINGVSPGSYSLLAGGDDFGVASDYRVSNAGASNSWEAKLDRGTDVRGRLVGPNDEPLEFLVRAEGVIRRSQWSDMTVADAEGHFVFPNSARSPMLFFVIDPVANPIGIPLLVDTLRPNNREQVFKLKASALERATVSIRLFDAGGNPVSNAEVRLLHPETKRGVFLQRDSAGGVQGRYSVSGLPLGAYYLEAIAPELGLLKLSDVQVLVQGEMDLGLFRFEAPGSLLVKRIGSGLDQVFEWRITQRDKSVNALVWAGASLGVIEGAENPTGQVPLPAGEYLLSLRTETLGNLSYPFQIVSGVETSLDVTFSETSEVTITSPGGRRGDYVIIDEATSTEVCRNKWSPRSGSWKLQLLPGFYRVRLRRYGSRLADTAFEVAPAKPATIILLR